MQVREQLRGSKMDNAISPLAETVDGTTSCQYFNPAGEHMHSNVEGPSKRRRASSSVFHVKVIWIPHCNG